MASKNTVNLKDIINAGNITFFEFCRSQSEGPHGEILRVMWKHMMELFGAAERIRNLQERIADDAKHIGERSVMDMDSEAAESLARRAVQLADAIRTRDEYRRLLTTLFELLPSDLWAEYEFPA